MSTPTSPAPPPDDAEGVDQALRSLAGGSTRANDLLPLSDLGRGAAATLAEAWPRLPEAVRVAAVRRMGELGEERVDLNFGRALHITLDDPSAVVRQLAVSALWEDERPDLLPRLLDLVAREASQDVRAAAAQLLGRFAERAALGDLDAPSSESVRSTLIGLVTDRRSPSGVRRRALESVAAFCNDREVQGLIEVAYASDDQSLQASALYAMGRNLDLRWLDLVLRELESDEAELRFEAARAAGQLGDDRAVPGLASLAADDDPEVRYAAVAALGQVGGRAAVRVLRNLSQTAGEEDADAIDAALEEALAGVDPLQVSV